MKLKRYLAGALAAVLLLGLAGCKKKAEDTSPEEPTAVETATPAPVAQTVPDATSEPVSYIKLVSDSFGLTLSYPSTWANNPGKHTICYYDPDDTTGYRTRFAVTSKVLRHSPDRDTFIEEFKEYLKVISDGFEKKSFEVGDLDEGATFLGQEAYSTTYLAFYGKVEIKGYVVTTVIDRTMYVFHFTTAISRYDSLSNLMLMVKESVTLNQPAS